MSQGNSSEPRYLKITLSADQAAILESLVETHRQRTRITGLLAAITRNYRSETEGVTVELQLIPLNRRLAAAITKAAKELRLRPLAP